MSRRLSAVILLLLCWVGASAADPYADWAQGRPAEAVGPLISAANATQRWDAWLDAGLAAAAAGRRGSAIACLLRAHAAAPECGEPRDALRALGAALPTTWCERVGPIGLPGFGWTAVALLALGGFAIAVAIGYRPRRLILLFAGGLVLAIAAPGLIAIHLDRSQTWVSPVRDTQALDSTGAPLRSLTEGTLLRSAGRIWDQRQAVMLGDGTMCWVPERDIAPAP